MDHSEHLAWPASHTTRRHEVTHWPLHLAEISQDCGVNISYSFIHLFIKHVLIVHRVEDPGPGAQDAELNLLRAYLLHRILAI